MMRQKPEDREPSGYTDPAGNEFEFQHRKKTLNEFERALRKGFDEYSAVFDSDGNRIVLKKGKESSVEFNEDELALMKDMTLSHNHLWGRSLSRKDVLFGIPYARNRLWGR